jgi:hypothetical protein
MQLGSDGAIEDIVEDRSENNFDTRDLEEKTDFF